MDLSQLVLHLAAMLLGAGAVYGAIRADLRHLAERISHLERRQDSVVDHLLNNRGNHHA